MYRVNLAKINSGDPRTTLAEFDRVLASVQGAADQLESHALDLAPIADRISQGPAAVRAEMGDDDFHEVVRRLACVVVGLGTLSSLRIGRETVAAMLD